MRMSTALLQIIKKNNEDSLYQFTSFSYTVPTSVNVGSWNLLSSEN